MGIGLCFVVAAVLLGIGSSATKIWSMKVHKDASMRGAPILVDTNLDATSSSSTVAVHNTRPADVAAHVPPDDVAAATSSRRDGLAALAALSKQADALLSAKAQETKAAKRDTARQEQLTRQQIAQPLCPLGSPPSPAPSRGA